MPAITRLYYLRGYDKDGGFYETLCVSNDLERLKELGVIVAKAHAVEELRRRGTDEPFDWFVIEDDNDDTLLVIAPGGAYIDAR